MYCTSCGIVRPQDATVCPNCGDPIVHYPPRPEIKNYLVPATLLGFCCCLPVGVVAIIYAAQVNSKLSRGDLAGAEAASRKAKAWCWAALGTGVLAYLAYAVLMMFSFAESS
jgi:hypothetical protein